MSPVRTIPSKGQTNDGVSILGYSQIGEDKRREEETDIND